MRVLLLGPLGRCPVLVLLEEYNAWSKLLVEKIGELGMLYVDLNTRLFKVYMCRVLTLILRSLRLIILFMEANFLVLFALGILPSLFSVHTCVSNVKMRKAKQILLFTLTGFSEKSSRNLE